MMDTFIDDTPLKVMIKDLCNFEKLGNFWLYACGKDSSCSVKIHQVHIQGEINKTAGFWKEILIVDDGTAKAKIIRGSQVPGDLKWIEEGQWCSVIGILVHNGKLPQIKAVKISQITNPVLQEMWPIEVQELKNVISEKVFPDLFQEIM